MVVPTEPAVRPAREHVLKRTGRRRYDHELLASSETERQDTTVTDGAHTIDGSLDPTDRSNTGGTGRMIRRVIGAVVAVAVVTVLVIRSDVNGWGWVVWALSAIGISVIRAPFERTNRENVITDDRQDTTESTVLALVGIGGGLVPLVHLLTGVFGFADYDLASWTYGVGAALTVVGLALFWRTHRDLGRNWSVTLEIRDEHTLVTDGIYARIRHPMYTAITVIYAATPFVLHNWIAGFVGLVSFLVLYAVRLPREEAMMLEHFGEQYADYRRRTGRLLPRLRSAR